MFMDYFKFKIWLIRGLLIIFRHVKHKREEVEVNVDKKMIGGAVEYIQKGVALKKIAAIPSVKKLNAEATKRLIKEKPMEALF